MPSARALSAAMVPVLAVCFLMVALTASAVPAKLQKVPTVAAKVKPLTQAEVAAAMTPPTAAQMGGILRGSATLRQALTQAAAGAVPNWEKIVPSKRPPAAASSAFGGHAYVLPPCDWDAGIWLTFNQPLAAPTWPSTGEWAVMVPEGLVLDSSGIVYSRTLAEVARCLPGNGIMSLWGGATEAAVLVKIKAPEPGVYAITLCLPRLAETPDEFDARMRGSGSFTLLASSIEGRCVIALLQTHSSHDNATVAFVRPTGNFWQAGGVSIRRLNY